MSIIVGIIQAGFAAAHKGTRPRLHSLARNCQNTGALIAFPAKEKRHVPSRVEAGARAG